MSTTSDPRIVSGDPALEFLDRASQLARLQERIVATIQREVNAESDQHDRSFQSATTEPSSEKMSAYINTVMAGLAASHQRWRDIQTMFQLFFSRQIDDFQTFLEHTLRDIATFEPSILEGIAIKKSATKLPENEISALRLRRLSYLSIREITEALQPRFVLFPERQTQEDVEKLYELRNLYVHNHGVADEHFLARFKDPRFVKGQAVELDPPFVAAAAKTLRQACQDIRIRSAEAFAVKWHGG